MFESDKFPSVKRYQVDAIKAAELALIEKGELHHLNWLETLRYELTHDEFGQVPWSKWTSQQRFYVTPEMLAQKWGTNGRPPDCGLCGHVFVNGDIARWHLIPSGAPNIFVCHQCDGSDVSERFIRYWNEIVRPIIRRWADV